MKITELHSINDYKNYSYNYWRELIELGYIIYIPVNEKVLVLNTNDFKVEFEVSLKEKDSFGIQVIGKKIFFQINNTVWRFDSNPYQIIKVFESSEESASILSDRHFYGRTFKRRPRVCRNNIVDSISNEIIYSSNEQDYLINFSFPYCLFQVRFSGEMFYYDLLSASEKWRITVDEGIPGRRFHHFKEEYFIIQKRVKENDYNWWADIQKRSLSDGEIDWEIKRGLEHYNTLSNSNEYIGIGGNRIHHFNSKGDVIYDGRLKEELGISSHLTGVFGDKLVFATHINTNIPALGLIDLNSYSLISIKEVEVSEIKSFRIGLDVPCLFENKIYVRDSEDRLRIFEIK